jgi:protoporphyrinogen oxidase
MGVKKLVYKDYTVVGSGIVGLHAALRLREKIRKVKY